MVKVDKDTTDALIDCLKENNRLKNRISNLEAELKIYAGVIDKSLDQEEKSLQLLAEIRDICFPPHTAIGSNKVKEIIQLIDEHLGDEYD